MTTDWDIPIAPELPTPEEAKALGERFLAGDQEAGDALIVGCRKLVATTVKGLLRKHEKALFGLTDGGDLHSAGLMGLVEGVRDLPNTNNVFAYLAESIRHEIADEIKRFARQPTVPLSDFPRLDREESPRPSESDLGAAIEKATKDAFAPEKDRTLLWLRRQCYTYAEIAEKTGVKPSTVGRRIRQYEEKMKKSAASGEKSGQDESLTRVKDQSKSNTNDGGTPMDPTLQAFVEANTHKRADARLKLVDLVGRFRSTLGGRDVKLWPRWRFHKELEAGGYVLGKDSDRVVYVAGLSFQPPRQWTVDDAGRLRLETVA